MSDVFEKIKQFNSNRIPELAERKCAFITEDTFRFSRGTCHLFHEGLAQQQDWKDRTRIWISGDLHLENFGTYKGDNRVVYFDLNNFDEAILAPAAWDWLECLPAFILVPWCYNWIKKLRTYWYQPIWIPVSELLKQARHLP